MKFRIRLITIGVLAAMLVGLGTNVGQAAHKNVENPDDFTNQMAASNVDIHLKFDDIKGYWAAPYIEQLAAAGILQGVGENRFAPDDEVETVQVLAMLVRMLGHEQLAKEYQQQLDTESAMKGIPPWASGYVKIAAAKGLVSEDELKDLRMGEKATRLSVARFVSRIFDVNDEITEEGLLDLDDVNALPAVSKADVSLMVQKGIMVGTPEGHWLPYELVTRGQMAKILSLILNRLGPTDRHVQIYGDIEEVLPGEKYKITVCTLADTLSYNVASDCALYVDHDRARLGDLAVGQRVQLLATIDVDDTVEVVYISARNKQAAELTVHGTIEFIKTGLQAAIITVDENGQETTFSVCEDTVVLLGGLQVFLSDLKTGQKSVVKGLDNGKTFEALEIVAKPNEELIEGTITSVVMHTKPSLSIEGNDGQNHVLSVTGRTQIVLNGQTTVLEDLRPKDCVTVQAADKEALLIDGRRALAQEQSVEGRITALVLGVRPSISIQTPTGALGTYVVDKEDTSIFVGDAQSTLDELKIGWKAQLKVLGDKAITIKASLAEV